MMFRPFLLMGHSQGVRRLKNQKFKILRLHPTFFVKNLGRRILAFLKIWRVHNALKSLDKKKFTFSYFASDFDASFEKFNFCVSHLVDIQFDAMTFLYISFNIFLMFSIMFFHRRNQNDFSKKISMFFFSNFHLCQTIVKTCACYSDICSIFCS